MNLAVIRKGIWHLNKTTIIVIYISNIGDFVRTSALSFKGAKELKTRIAKSIAKDYKEFWKLTGHEYCAFLLGSEKFKFIDLLHEFPTKEQHLGRVEVQHPIYQDNMQ